MAPRFGDGMWPDAVDHYVRRTAGSKSPPKVCCQVIRSCAHCWFPFSLFLPPPSRLSFPSMTAVIMGSCHGRFYMSCGMNSFIWELWGFGRASRFDGVHLLSFWQVVLQTKEMITKHAEKIAKQADEHEQFLNKVGALILMSAQL